MAKGTNVPVKPFVNEELERLKEKLHAAGMKIPSNEAVVGGLVLAGCAFPPEAVMPFIAEFWRREHADAKDEAEATTEQADGDDEPPAPDAA